MNGQQPVKVKVFDIGKEAGGLKVTKKGGGMQTKSLRLEDKNGKEFALRSVEKFPDATLPEEFRQTVIKDAVVDGISASYPFAAFRCLICRRLPVCLMQFQNWFIFLMIRAWVIIRKSLPTHLPFLKNASRTGTEKINRQKKFLKK